MGKALYRRYRSTSFDEVLGQEHITTTLKNAVTQKSFAHAYLLTGPRGVGKTSIARILAFAVNDLDYDPEANHLDIIEIDAASNRRIDEIRALRERVHIAPTSAPYKVYIIDEVHMLTREAFNALLKTLEEPPEHVIFILATTDIHKVPETIVSRCVRFTFRPIDSQNITKHLSAIAKQEKLTVTPEALELIAVHAGGSFRDSISLLEQVKNIGVEIDKNMVEKMLGVAPQERLGEIMTAIQTGQPLALETTLLAIYAGGTSPEGLAKQLAGTLREQIITNSLELPHEQVIDLLRQLLHVPGAPQPRADLELALLGITLRQTSQTVPKNNQPIQPPEITATEPDPVQKNKKPEADEAIVETVRDAKNQELWEAVLERLKQQHNTLYGIARMAQVSQTPEVLELRFQFAFHHKQMSEPKNKAILAKVLEELSSSRIDLVVVLANDVKPSITQTTPPIDTDLSAISNIFGSHEVLES